MYLADRISVAIGLQLVDNVALVTASSSGLGKASAAVFAEEHANVVVNGRGEERLDDAVKELDVLGDGRVIGVSGDLTDPDDIEMLVDRTFEEFGQLDHLVTNAGGPPSGRSSRQPRKTGIRRSTCWS